jgi:cytochrome P450
MRAPGPPGDPYLGHWRHLRADTIGLMLRGMTEYGDVVRFERRGVPIHLLAHPDHVKHVLQDNVKNYVRQSPGYTKIRTVVGNGLVAADGELWKKHRRIIQGAFVRERVLSFAEPMRRATREMLAAWPKDGPIDISAEMMRLTLRIVTETLIGTAKGTRVDAISDALSYVLRDASERVDTLEFPENVPTPRNRRFRRALDTLHDVIDRTIAERRASGEAKDDLVGRLMAARDEETGEGMTDIQLRDEIMTMFFVGHDSTAHALTWTFYCMSLHPDARRDVLAEVDQVLGDREPEIADLTKLPTTDRVFKESMRLFPPVWILVRAVAQADRVGDYDLPARSIVIVSPIATHHNPRLWDAPEGFDPDRFLPDRDAGRSRYAYFPFGGGPRTCLGYAFAMMEAETILSMISQRVTLDLVPGQHIVPFQGFTLSPRGGMWMQAQKRERA